MAFFGAPASQVQPKKVANIDEQDVTSNQEAIVVPYLAGWGRTALVWFTPVYNPTTTPVQSQTGKSSSSTTGYKYSGDLGGLICLGPLDVLQMIIIDRTIAWQGNLVRGSNPYDSISAPATWATARIYWGTEDQPIDDLILGTRGALSGGIDPRIPSTWPPNPSGGGPVFDGEAPGDPNLFSGHYDLHGAYLGQAWIAFKGLQFGLGRNAAPNVEVICGRATSWFGDTRTTLYTFGVQPLGSGYEALTHKRYGGELDDSQLDQTSFEAAASDLSAALIAPQVTQAMQLSAFLDELRKYFDGWFRQNQGKIEAGFFPHGPIDTSSLPHIGNDDLIGRPDLKSEGYEGVNNYFWDIFTNQDRYYYKNDSARYTADAARLAVGGETKRDVMQTPWIIAQVLADQHAMERGLMQSVPAITGELQIKREVLQSKAIKIGGWFIHDSDVFEASIVMRCLSIEWPDDKTGSAKVGVESERSIRPTAFVPSTIAHDPDFVFEPADVRHARIVELPSGLTDRNAVQVAVLAKRPNIQIVGFNVFASTDNTTFAQVAAQNHFAGFGVVASNYTAATSVIDTTVGIVIDFYGVDLLSIISQTDQQRDNNNLLLWIENEIFSVGQMTALGNGRFKVFVKRALYGTAQVAHNTNAQAWFIYRDQIVRIDNKNFAAGSTRYFKLQPYTSDQALDLSLATSISYAFGTAPAVGSVYNVSLATSAGIAQGKTPDIRIIAMWDALSDQDIVLFEVNWQKTTDTQWQSGTTQNKVLDFSVDPDTLYNVRIRAINRHGVPSDWIATEQIVSGTLSQFEVHHFELDGQADSLEFGGRIAKLRWGITSRDSFEEIGMESGGIQAGEQDPLFKDYLLEVRDPVTDELLWERAVVDPRYDLDLLEAVGYKRQVVCEVVARSTVANLVSVPNRIVISNTLPAPLGNLNGVPGFTTVHFTHYASGDFDFAGVIGLRSQDFAFADVDFDLSNPGAVSFEECYRGPGVDFDVPQDQNTLWYYRFAAFDTFTGRDPSTELGLLAFSDALGMQTMAVTPPLAPAVYPPSQDFTAAFDASVAARTNETLRFAIGREVVATDSEWPKSSGVYTTRNIAETEELHVAGFFPDGTKSLEAIRYYRKTDQGATCATPAVDVISTNHTTGVQTLKIVDATPGSTMFKRQGNPPSGAFASYGGGNFAIPSGFTVEFYGTASGLANSPIDTYTNDTVPGGGL